MTYLENIDLAKKTIDQKKKKITTEEVQVDMFNYKIAGVASMLEKIDLDELTPKDALEVLYKLKEKCSSDKCDYHPEPMSVFSILNISTSHILGFGFCKCNVNNDDMNGM